MSQPSLKRLADLIRWIEAQEDPQMLCLGITQHLVQQLNLPDQVLYLTSSAGSLVQVAAAGGKFCPDTGVVNPIQLEIGQGVVGLAAQQANAVLVEDTRQSHLYLVDDQLRLAELAVPVVHQAELLGVLDSEHPQAGFFQPDHQYFYQSIAAVLAARLANLQARQRLAASALLSSGAVTGKTLLRHSADKIAWCGWDEFASAVVVWLKHFYQEQRWDMAVLERLAMLASVCAERMARVQLIRQSIEAVIAQLCHRPATALWGHLLHDRYTGQRLGQLQLADHYHMAFSTFRRHQSQAIHCLTEELWKLELSCRQQD